MRTAFLHLRLDREVKRRFRERCRERGITLTWVVEQAVQAFLTGAWDPTVAGR